tara:strand:+ start:295 stop:495 length:201 start_codon:yes stop_codon:yes gene_type:complete
MFLIEGILFRVGERSEEVSKEIFTSKYARTRVSSIYYLLNTEGEEEAARQMAANDLDALDAPGTFT